MTHSWTSIDVRANLPPGPWRDLVERPGLERHLHNGTMFPDGGYACPLRRSATCSLQPGERVTLTSAGRRDRTA